MKKQIKLKNKSKSPMKYSFGGDLGKFMLNNLETATLGSFGMDFYKPKFDSDTFGKIDQTVQGINHGAQNAMAGIASAMNPKAGAVINGIRGIGANTQFHRNGMNVYQGGQEINQVQMQDMIPHNLNYLDKVSENLIQMDGPSHNQGGIKTNAGEFDREETIMKKGVVGNPTPFAFSDNLKISKEVQKQLGLPTNMRNKTIADASKFIENKYETKYNDMPIQRNTKDRMKQSLYTKLMNANKIEFAKNRIENGIQSKEDMSFDELNSQYQSGGEVYKLYNGAEMSKESAIAYAKTQGFDKLLKTPTDESLARAGFNYYNNQLAGEMRKQDGDFRHLGNDPENPEITNRTDAQKANPLLDVSNIIDRPVKPEFEFTKPSLPTSVIEKRENKKPQKIEWGESYADEDDINAMYKYTLNPTYKYNGIEYKKVDGQWMWKSNKTGALHPAKNFNDDFIERNNLEPGVDKVFKPKSSPNKKSIQNKTPYDEIENNYDAFYNTDNTSVEPLDDLFYSKPKPVTKKQESYPKPGLMDVIGSSFNRKAGEPNYRFSDYFSNLINTKATDRYDRNGKKYQSGMEVDLFPKKQTYEWNTNNVPQEIPSQYMRNYEVRSKVPNIQAINGTNKTTNWTNYLDYSKNSPQNFMTKMENGELSTDFKIPFTGQKGSLYNISDYMPKEDIINSDMENRARNIKVNTLDIPDITAKMDENDKGIKDKQSNFWNSMSDLEKIGLGANALSTLGQGLTMLKKDKIPTFYNENSSQINNIMSDRRIDIQPMINDLNSQYNAATSKDNSRSWNVQRGLNTNMYNQYAKSLGELGMKEQEMNNQYKSQYAETLNNLGMQNVQARTTQEELQARTDAARQNALRVLMANTGENLSNFAFTKNLADKTIQEGFKYLSMVSPDFGLNASNIKEFSTMIADPEMSVIKANMEGGKYLGQNAYEQMVKDIEALNLEPNRKAQALQMAAKLKSSK